MSDDGRGLVPRARDRAARGIAELRRSFPAPGGLDRCETILQLQCRSLEEEPPPAALGDAVRLAALGRVRAGEPVIPPSRFPLEVARVARMLRRLVIELFDEPPDVPRDLDTLLAPALEAAANDDAAGVAVAAGSLGLAASAGAALIRESLKPELLRTSAPFVPLLGETLRDVPSCPLCGSGPCAGTVDHVLCCRWCGLTWRWRGGTCADCGGRDLHSLALTAVARDACMVQCRDCGAVLKLFTTSADPLVLSLHGVLAAPLELAARLRSGAGPTGGFPVF